MKNAHAQTLNPTAAQTQTRPTGERRRNGGKGGQSGIFAATTVDGPEFIVWEALVEGADKIDKQLASFSVCMSWVLEALSRFAAASGRAAAAVAAAATER